MLLLRHRIVLAQSVHHSFLLVAHPEDVQKHEVHAMRRHSLSLSRSSWLCLHRPLHLFSCPLQLVPGLRRAGSIYLEFMAGFLDQLDAELFSRRVP
jgi:hypothetical protein